MKQFDCPSCILFVAVWDWKALKFKSKHYRHGSPDDHHSDDDVEDHSDLQGHAGGKGHDAVTSADHRRRRREQPRPPPTDAEPAGDSHRFVTEDGRILQPSEVAGAAPGVTDGPVEITDAPEMVTLTAIDAVDAPEFVTKAPRDVAASLATESEESAATEGETPTEAGVTDAAATASDVGVTTEASRHEEVDPEGAGENDDDDVTEYPHSDDEVIVHSFPEADRNQPLLGAGTTKSLEPEYAVSDEIEDIANDGDNTRVKDNPRESDEDVSEEVTDSTEETLPIEEPGHVMMSHDTPSHGDDHSEDEGDSVSDSDADDHGDNHSADHPPHDGDDGGDDDDSNHGDHHHHDKDGKKTSPKDHGKLKTYGHYGHSKFLHETTSCQHGIHYLADVGTTLITEVSGDGRGTGWEKGQEKGGAGWEKGQENRGTGWEEGQENGGTGWEGGQENSSWPVVRDGAAGVS